MNTVIVEFLGPNDVSTTTIYTHVLNRRPAGITSPADCVLDPSPPNPQGNAR